MHQQDIEIRDKFLHTLDGLLFASAHFDGASNFLLIHNTFGTGNELGDHYGAREAVAQLVALTHSLRAALDSTDLVCRTGKDFWILSPFDDRTEKVCDKTRSIFDSIEHRGLHIVSRKTAVFKMSEAIPAVRQHLEAFDADRLLQYLAEHLSSLATCSCTNENPCPDLVQVQVNAGGRSSLLRNG